MRSSCSRRCAARTRSSRCSLRASAGPACRRAIAPALCSAPWTASPTSTSCSPRASPRYDYFFGTSRTSRSTRPTSPTSSRRTSPTSSISSTRCTWATTWSRRRGACFREAPILYTLHEYLPICHRQGQMLRTEHKNEELCLKASPRRCNECFPDIPSSEFFLRERCIKAHLDHVDLFIAPSQFLLQRYVDWGIPPDRIVCEDYGRQPAVRLAETESRPAAQPLRLLRPVQPLQGRRDAARGDGDASRERPDIQLRLHGANLDQQTDEFQESFAALLEQAEANVTLVGSYHPADLPLLMRDVDWVVVPSRWWENSPLVIQEAFMQRRPVICSGIGGMAEKVTHDVNGLHFNVGDAEQPGCGDRARGERAGPVGAPPRGHPRHPHRRRPHREPDPVVPGPARTPGRAGRRAGALATTSACSPPRTSCSSTSPRPGVSSSVAP